MLCCGAAPCPPLCVELLRMLGLPCTGGGIWQRASSLVAQGLLGGPALLMVLLPHFSFPVPAHGMGQQLSCPWAELEGCCSQLWVLPSCSVFYQRILGAV